MVVPSLENICRKYRWKIIFGILELVSFAFSQNTSQAQVDQNAEQALLNYLQDNGLGFTLQTDNITRDTTNTSSQLPIPKNQTSQIPVSNQILKYNEFLNTKQLQFFLNSTLQFETTLQALLAQNQCQKDFESFGRTNFNAIGVIKVKLEDGTEEFCTGTLIGDEAVITIAECFQKNGKEFWYLPSWENESEWKKFRGAYIPDVWISDKEHNFAIFYLSEKLDKAPRIGYTIAVSQPQICTITLLGLKKDSGVKTFKMVNCPHLPKIQQKLGINSQTCKSLSCNLDDMNFEMAAPIILSCISSREHSIIGMLKFEEDSKSNNSYAVPYMFTQEMFWDIKDNIVPQLQG